jgi:hypothetical protein
MSHPFISSSRPSSALVPVTADSPVIRELAESLVGQARTDGIELTGDNGLLTHLIARPVRPLASGNGWMDRQGCTSRRGLGSRSTLPTTDR